MAEERNIPPRNNGQKEASAPMKHGTPSEILPVETMIDFPYSPSLFIFSSLSVYLSLLVFLFLLFLFEQALLQWLSIPF